MSFLSSAAPAATSLNPPAVPAEAAAVVGFWRDAGPGRWFLKDPEFDRGFRDRFLGLYDQAAEGRLAHWMATPESALALVLLLDQFPRNAFRGSPRMFATDAMARAVAAVAISAGFDRLVDQALRLFIYIPFGHSEDFADQERSVALCRDLDRDTQAHAVHHRDIVRRVGRFPHRNPILGRAMRPEEQQFLDDGGFAG